MPGSQAEVFQEPQQTHLARCIFSSKNLKDFQDLMADLPSLPFAVTRSTLLQQDGVPPRNARRFVVYMNEAD